jgi:hypothetical protein
MARMDGILPRSSEERRMVSFYARSRRRHHRTRRGAPRPNDVDCRVAVMHALESRHESLHRNVHHLEAVGFAFSAR